MFGTLRYLLALMVVVTHFLSPYMRWPGYYAVFSFYVLSGFLMTKVLNERYGFTSEGLKGYFANRALRIFPPYWTILIFSMALVHFLPEVSRAMNPLIRPPENPAEWLENIFIFGQYFDPGLERARLVPPAWSLHVELFFYAAMGLLVSRSFFLTALWFFASLAYTLTALFGHWEFYTRYFTVMAGSLGFSLGALLFFIKPYFRAPRWLFIPASALFLLNVLLAGRLWRYVMVHGFYLSIFLSAVLILSLSGLKAKEAPGWIRRLDGLLGDLSYPLFLCHWSVGIAVVWIVFRGESPDALTLFLSTLPFINIASYLIHRGLESRVEGIRDRIKEALPASARKERAIQDLLPSRAQE